MLPVQKTQKWRGWSAGPLTDRDKGQISFPVAVLLLLVLKPSSCFLFLVVEEKKKDAILIRRQR